MDNTEIVRSSLVNLATQEREAEKKSKFDTALNSLLKQPMSRTLQDKYSKAGLHIGNGTIYDAISASLVMQALNGNINAYAMIRDTTGHKPIDRVQSDVVVRIDMGPKARELGE